MQNHFLCQKLYHRVRLHEDGWRACDDGVDVLAPCRNQRDDPNLYMRGDRCLSYYAALNHRTEIFVKNVDSIPHNATDAFYRCLILMEGSRLRKALQDFPVDFSRASSSAHPALTEEVAAELAADEGNDNDENADDIGIIEDAPTYQHRRRLYATQHNRQTWVRIRKIPFIN